MAPQPNPPFAGGATPLPNVLVDRVLPTLKDTELRVLLVVLRQTRGWTTGTPPRSKARDWLSGGQLRQRTGRSREAVSGAVDALVRRGLLVVEDAAGRPLPSAAARQRHLGKLFYRLGDLGKTGDRCRSAKPKTTTDTLNNKEGAALCPGKGTGQPRPAVRPRGGGWHRAGD